MYTYAYENELLPIYMCAIKKGHFNSIGGVKMNVSTYWDMENNKGELIIHRNNERVVTFISPKKTLKEFNDWSEVAIQYIQCGGSE